MKVKEVVAGQTLEKVDPGEYIIIAHRQMEGKAISALLVFEGNRFEGILTMVDIAHAGFGQGGDKVKDVMTPASKVLYVSTEDTLQKCGELMNTRHIHHLPVKNSEGDIVGIISALDLARGLEEQREKAAEDAKNMFKT